MAPRNAVLYAFGPDSIVASRGRCASRSPSLTLGVPFFQGHRQVPMPGSPATRSTATVNPRHRGPWPLIRDWSLRAPVEFWDMARRFWMYPKDSWNAGPALSIYPGGDEYGNSTLVLQLPGQRALVVAYNWPLRRELEPCEGRVEYAIADRLFDEEPEPVLHEDRHQKLPASKYLVRRDVMYGPWEQVDPE